MVLKRKLPTQETNKEKVVEEAKVDDFDMSLETDKKPTKAKIGHDLNDDFPDQMEDRPEDFIPEELRALEKDMPVLDEAESKPSKPSAEIKEEPLPQGEINEEDIKPISFDDDFETIIDGQNNTSSLVKEESFEQAPINNEFSAEEPFDSKKPSVNESTDFDLNPMEFDSTEPVNWEEVSKESNSAVNDDFLDTKWDNDTSVEVKTEIADDRFSEDEVIDDGLNLRNDGIVPEIPGMSESFGTKSAEFMGVDSEELNLNGNAKKKLAKILVILVLVVGGGYVFMNTDKTTEIMNRWSGALTEAPQIADENQDLDPALNIEDNIASDKNIDISFNDEESDIPAKTDDGMGSEDDADLFASLGDEEIEEDEDATKINLLDPEEKTKSGKEIIKAEGDEELPEDVKEGVNLITNISEEIERQKALRRGEKVDLEDENSDKKEANDKEYTGTPVDINKKIDEELAQYRKLLAAEKDPGKKLKPGQFFSGDATDMPEKADVKVAKVLLGEDVRNTGNRNNSLDNINGHQIIEYPDGAARDNNDGIRTLDHFRSLIVEKEDKRVRVPKNISPSIRNQGFPKFKVISIVPNYGLVGEYNGKKGILMIGDTFKGWELIGVYETYAEFKSDTRKHIITLN